MLPNVWLHKQPIPKLRSTFKHLVNWTNQDIIALAYEEFGCLDLDNKQIQVLVKKLKLEPLYKPHTSYYNTAIDTFAAPQINLKPNKFKAMSVDQVLDLIQDSKVCWEDAFKSHMANTKPKMSNNMCIPLPDNAADTKKYWGLQVGDHLQSEDGELFVVTQVRPVLDGAPTVVYEKLELHSQS